MVAFLAFGSYDAEQVGVPVAYAIICVWQLAPVYQVVSRLSSFRFKVRFVLSANLNPQFVTLCGPFLHTHTHARTHARTHTNT